MSEQNTPQLKVAVNGQLQDKLVKKEKLASLGKRMNEVIEDHIKKELAKSDPKNPQSK